MTVANGLGLLADFFDRQVRFSGRSRVKGRTDGHGMHTRAQREDILICSTRSNRQQQPHFENWISRLPVFPLLLRPARPPALLVCPVRWKIGAEEA